MYKKQNSIPSAGTKADRDTLLIDGSSSHNSSKPNVGCCTSMETLKENILKSDIVSDATKMIIGAFIDNQLGYEKQQIINTFKDAQALCVMGNDMRAEQYFNKTFKK